MIRTNGLSKVYQMGGAKVFALRSADIYVPEGSFAAIVGSSGSGKSTLLNILGLLDKPDSGEYFLCGKEVSKLSSRELSRLRSELIGFVFQSFNLLPGFTALENVELGLTVKNIPPRLRRELSEYALESVGLKDRINHLPSEMSGGQQQRTAIARAIAGGPKLIHADEPTGNLDEASSEAVMELLTDQHKKGVTMIVITHSSQGAAMAQNIYPMKNGILESPLYDMN